MATNPETTSGAPPYALPEYMSFGGAPAGVATDSQYLAAEAGLRNDISSQYADLLGQLGYIDPATGKFLPGSVQQSADLQEAQLRQNQGQAELGVNQNAQNQGTLFSGVRGDQLAQADLPFQQQIGQVEFQTPVSLAGLYRQAAGLMGTYNTQNAALLADAAGRRTAAIDAQPAASTPVPTDTATTPPPSAPPALPYTTSTAAGGGTGGRGVIGGYARGGEVSEPQVATVGEDAVPNDPITHEVIVPRRGLLPHENAVLTALAQRAHHRLGRGLGVSAARGLRQISSLLSPTPVGPAAEHLVQAAHGMPMSDEASLPMLPAPAPVPGSVGMAAGEGAERGAPATSAYGLAAQGDTDAAAALWEHRHPYAMRHGGAMPGFVEDAISRRLSSLHPMAPLHVHLPPPPATMVPSPRELQ